MIEYDDGTFSEIMPAGRLFAEMDKMDLSAIRAIHFGTPSELKAVREKVSLEQRMADLEQKISDLSPVVRSDCLIIPEDETIRKILGGHNAH